MASADEETGDLIVKIVNAGGTEMKLNLKVGLTGTKLKGTAKIVSLQNSKTDSVSTLEQSAVVPYTRVVNGFSDTLGVTVEAYSGTAIRLRTK